MFLERKSNRQKFSKREFLLKSVAFLGNVESKEGLRVDPQEVELVKNRYDLL